MLHNLAPNCTHVNTDRSLYLNFDLFAQTKFPLAQHVWHVFCLIDSSVPTSVWVNTLSTIFLCHSPQNGGVLLVAKCTDLNLIPSIILHGN